MCGVPSLEADLSDVEPVPSAPAVRLEGVVKRFGDVVAVDGVDLDVREGEFFSMLGPSGSGKTTCLRMIAGFETPTAGRIALGGRYVTGLAPYEREVNTVFQDYALFPHMTVADNVGYGLMVRKVPRAERRRARRGCPGDGAPPGIRRPEAGSALRRSATAGRARARPGDAAEGPAARRAAGRARPQAPSGDADRAEGDPGRGQAHLHLRHARPGRSAHDERSPRGVQSRPHRTGGLAGRRLRASGDGLRRRVRRCLQRARGRDRCRDRRRSAPLHDPTREDLDERARRARGWRLLHRDRPCAGGRVPGSHHPVHRRARSWAARSS